MNHKIEDFVVIVGAMKSGTTSLFNYLAQHPEIAVPHTKELNFFSDQTNFAQGYSHYLDSWDWNENSHKYALESSPWYTRITYPNNMNAAANIAKMQADLGSKFKFIYIMRDPIDRIESQYNHALVWHEHENIGDPTAEVLDSEALDTSKYAMQIKEYYQRFPSSDILLLKFEDLTENPNKVLHQICVFLSIDPNYSFESLGKVYNSRGSRKVIIIPGWPRLKKTRVFSLISENTPLKIKEVFRAIFRKKTKVKTNIKLSNAQKKYAKQELERDLTELKDNYKVDINSWGL